MCCKYVPLTWYLQNPEGQCFTVDDLRYILEWYNSNNLAPMKFRLGIIANARLAKVNEETGIKEYIEEKHIRLTIYGGLNAKTINIVGDLPHPVSWLHNKEKGQGHWESIGPHPNSKGIRRFRDCGLETAARDIIMATKLYRVTKDAFIRWNKFYEKDDPYDFPILEPQTLAWLYKHPSGLSGAHLPVGHKSIPGYWFALKPGSTIHAHWPTNSKAGRTAPGQQQSWVSDTFILEKQLQYIESYQSESGWCQLRKTTDGRFDIYDPRTPAPDVLRKITNKPYNA